MQNDAPPLFAIILLVAIVIFMIYTMWKLFEKAGKPGWAAIIPIYNIVVMLEIAGKPGWWTLLFFIPIVNYVFIIWTYNMISKSFGKDEGFTIGLVMLGVVFFPILAFGDDQYLGPYGLRDQQSNNQSDILDSNI